jgi:hypothetical protein
VASLQVDSVGIATALSPVCVGHFKFYLSTSIVGLGLSKRGAKAFSGAGRQRGQIDELSRLRQELAKVKEERDILKKAAAYFAKELG